MAKSLKEYNPEALEFKITHNSSVGGASNTTKFPGQEQQNRDARGWSWFDGIDLGGTCSQ